MGRLAPTESGSVTRAAAPYNVDMETTNDDLLSTGRLEAFSDGVFAIAITLLVIELHVGEEGGSLVDRLWDQWPSYAGFLISFVTIGVMWINHHAIFKVIERVDHGILVANLGLLLGITFLPFPTKVLGDAFGDGSTDDRRTAVVFYSLVMVFIAAMFIALWLWASRGNRLIDPRTPADVVRARTRRFLPGVPIYLATAGVSLVNPYVGLVMLGALAVFFLLPYGSDVSSDDA